MTISNPNRKFTLSLGEESGDIGSTGNISKSGFLQSLGEPGPLHAAVLSHREMRFVVVIGFMTLLAHMGLAVIFGTVLGQLIHQ